MDFAPYQSSPPEHDRVASPDYKPSPRASQDARRPFSPPSNYFNNNNHGGDGGGYTDYSDSRSPPPLQHPQPQRGWTGFDGQTGGWTAGGGGGGGGAGAGGAAAQVPGAYPPAEVSEFDTTLGLRLDYEACLAYLALPPVGAIILLILERNSDYVRLVEPIQPGITS